MSPFRALPHKPDSLKGSQRSNPPKFREDLFNIARTTLSSKVLSQDKEYFANLAVDAVLRLKVDPVFLEFDLHSIDYQGSIDLEHIQIIKKVGGKLTDSYLDEGAYLSSPSIALFPETFQVLFWIKQSL